MHNARLLFTRQLDVVLHQLWKNFFYLGADVSVVKADKNLSKISKYPTQESSKIAVHAFITSILVYCNSLLYTVILGSYYNSKTGLNILGTG